MPAKRPPPSGATPGSTTKHPKTEHQSSDDFSSSVKKKLSASTRTGQACDRCKVRKIRCDGRPGGCSPCVQNNTECKTTDRITGRATTRGHTEQLEYENNHLKGALYALQQQLKEIGVEPRIPSNPQAPQGFAPSLSPQPQSAWQNGSHDGQLWGSTPPAPSTASLSNYPHMNDANGTRDTDQSQFHGPNLPTFRAGLHGDNYLGVSSANSVLSPIKGTSLSFFGMEIDLNDFVPDDVEDSSNPVSYQHFLSVALNAPGCPRPKKEELPASYSECATYATWYFRGLHPYAPVLYKPHFMELLSRIYSDPTYQPTPAEEVQVQMVLAFIKYQFSARNGNAESLKQAHAHYRYALSFFYTLVNSHTIADVQALTMICLHLRNFPKPGAAWMMSSMTFMISVELGLHRSARAWTDMGPKRDPIEVETRKRVFWTLHGLYIALCGRLGRPMPLRMEDIDVEFPEPIHDYLPSETNLSDFRKCSFHVGLQAIRILAVHSEMYSTIHAVRQSPDLYATHLRRLEDEHRKWKEQVPLELREGSRADSEDYIFSLYVQFWDHEFNLMLHHPAMCRSRDPELLNSNMSICIAATSKMVRVLDEVRKYKSLDAPWVNCTAYLAAMLTTLFVYSHRKDELTSSDLAKLKSEMDMWLLIMDECGSILGSGKRLEKACRSIIDHTVQNISHHLAKKTASAASAVANVLKTEPDTSPRQEPTPAPSYANNNAYASAYGHTVNGHANVHKPSTGGYLPPDDPSLSQSSNPYPTVQAQYSSYPEQAQTRLPYQNGAPRYEQTQYNVPGGDMNAAHVAAAASAAATQDSSAAFAYPPGSHGNFGQVTNQSDAWRQWMMTNLGPQEYHHASALMALGHTGGHDTAVSTGADDNPGVLADMHSVAVNGLHSPHPAVSAAAVAQAAHSQQLWPLMVFDIGQQGGPNVTQ
nr:putative Zn(2)-Cys6 transcription factor [Neofusicoccum parvum]UPH72873.1 putative Zn(2)-Cys6 transcription factor [Neofusicoccum parvum]